jgi:hypothetical protein
MATRFVTNPRRPAASRTLALRRNGVHDKGILKAVFLAGGPGSGKSYAASELFSIPRGSPLVMTSAGGLKLVNSDPYFEVFLRKMGIDPKDLAKMTPAEFAAVTEGSDSPRGRAKRVREGFLEKWLDGRLGLILDGTGDDFKKIRDQSEKLRALGYDTMMVFVNTSLDVAKKRNRQRARSLPDHLVESIWTDVQNNIGHFQDYFGKENMVIVDATVAGPPPKSLVRAAEAFVQRPVRNRVGRAWIESQLPNKPAKMSASRRRNPTSAEQEWLRIYETPTSMIFNRTPADWDVLVRLVREGRIVSSGKTDAGGHELFVTRSERRKSASRRRNPAHLAHPGHFRQGQVVRLRGSRKRYVIATDVNPEVFGYHLVALSGGEAGSAPSGVRANEIELDADQTVSFSGAQAQKLRRKYAETSKFHQAHQRSLQAHPEKWQAATRAAPEWKNVAAKLYDLSDNNLHTEAVAELARFAFPRDSKWVKVMEAAVAMHVAYGSLPPGVDQIRSEVYKAAMAAIRRNYGPEAADEIAQSF